MNFSIGIKFFAMATLSYLSFPSNADEPVDQPRTEIERIKEENIKLSQHEKISEDVIPRGSPEHIQSRTISVFLPENASNIHVKAYMKNEPWGGGGAQNPPKPNTDDMGNTDYKECPMGSGDCPIAWSKVDNAITRSLPNGRTMVSAVFYNWVGRNDRTGKLVVTYQLE